MIAGILRFICKILFRVNIHGLENIPKENGLLIIANHESFLDGLLLGLFLPKRTTFVVHNHVLKNGLFKLFLAFTSHLAVDPSSPFAIKKVIKRLDADENVVIFPADRIALRGRLMQVYDGLGFVTAKTNARILPVHIEGAAQFDFGRLSDKRPRKLLPKVTLTILPSTNITVEIPTDGKRLSAKQRRTIAGEQMRVIMQKMQIFARQNKTIFENFLDAIVQFGANAELIEDINTVAETYQALLKKSLALGRITCKVSKPQEAVAVLMPNVTNTVALILGMTAFNRIPALLNYTAGTASIQNACIAADIKTIITSHKFIEVAKLEQVLAGLKNLNILYLEDLRPSFNLLDKLWLMAFALHFPRLAIKSVKPESPAVILFTSGSEGKPKGVVHAHKSILANTAQVMAIYDLVPEDKFMMALPLFHAFGLTGSLVAILNGINILIFPSPLQYKVISEIIYDRGCTVLFSTSTFLGNYAKFAHPHYFNKLRLVIAGAEKLNDEVRKIYAEKFGIRILEAYGATECAPGISANTFMANVNGSVGLLFPGMASKLEAVQGIAEGGLLYVKGDNVMLGYTLFDNPGVLLPPGDGWYNTGDIVEIDAQGFLYIKGRVKRFAKVAGEMISLEIVEKIAQTAAPEHQHAATTQIDAQRGENIILYTTDKALKREDLKIVAKNLGSPEIAIARKIIVMEEIPLLGTGKTDYVTLKNMAESARNQLPEMNGS